MVIRTRQLEDQQISQRMQKTTFYLLRKPCIDCLDCSVRRQGLRPAARGGFRQAAQIGPFQSDRSFSRFECKFTYSFYRAYALLMHASEF